MPRISRMIVPDQKCVYHVMSRTALEGYPFGDMEKDEMVRILKRFSSLYFTEVLGFCIMGNHFHLLVRMFPGHHFTDEELRKRYVAFFANDDMFTSELIPCYREKWSSLSEFVKDIKQTFSRYYNRLHNRRGTLWGERFKSVIVEDGNTLINCLAYIDLNPLRAGLVERPEEYRWNSLGYHIQRRNRDGFLSFDFGLIEFRELNVKERLKRYRRYVYEAGAVSRPEEGIVKVIDEKVLEKERASDFDLGRIRRFQYRTRYFTDSGIIGTKEFVTQHYSRFKDHFESRHEKKPKPIKGLDGIYSLKRLSEAI